MGKDPEILTEYVRQKLARSIISAMTDADGTLPVITLATGIEDLIRESIQTTEQGSYMAMDPNIGQKIIEEIQKVVDKVSEEGYQPIIISAPVVRRHLRKLIERFMPQLVVLSHNELTSQSKIQSLGTVEI